MTRTALETENGYGGLVPAARVGRARVGVENGDCQLEVSLCLAACHSKVVPRCNIFRPAPARLKLMKIQFRLHVVMGVRRPSLGMRCSALAQQEHVHFSTWNPLAQFC